MTLRPALLWIALLAAASTTHAQGVWRCGADGRQFTDKPCEQGRVLDTLEPRPAQDLAAAQAQARREQALAAQLVKEREQREAQAARLAYPAKPVKAKAAPAPPKRQAKQRRPADDGIWRAVAPATRQKKG